METSKDIFLLTGAGFSTSYLNYNNQELTTKYITSLVMDKKKLEVIYKDLLDKKLIDASCKEKLFQIPEMALEIKKLLLSKTPDADPNFEHFIYGLEMVCKHQERSKTYIKKHSNSFVGDKWQLEISLFKFKKKINITREHIYILKEFILRTVQLFLNELNLDDSDIKRLTQFIKKIKAENQINHYSLNYDCLFDKCFESDQNPIKKTYLSGISIFETQFPTHYLHGSVLYENEGKDFLINPSSSVTQKEIEPLTIYSSYENDFFLHRMITGLSKETKLLDFPYDALYQKMILDFHSSKELWIIGYSFSDSHINSVLRQALPFKNKVILVDNINEKENVRIFLCSKFIERIFFDGNLTYNGGGAIDTPSTFELKNLIQEKKNKTDDWKRTDKCIYQKGGKEIIIEWYLEGTKRFIEDYFKNNQ